MYWPRINQTSVNVQASERGGRNEYFGSTYPNYLPDVFEEFVQSSCEAELAGFFEFYSTINIFLISVCVMQCRMSIHKVDK